ncbi:MAG: hypothetical protein M1530_00725 [Candidatus Marsarchaeota archaeon]|nr:hypothetical protein [Candidatus Marsarchaeota archaeon]
MNSGITARIGRGQLTPVKDYPPFLKTGRAGKNALELKAGALQKTVQAMRLKIEEKAREHSKGMVRELKATDFSYIAYMHWDLQNDLSKWEWPTAGMHRELEEKLGQVLKEMPEWQKRNSAKGLRLRWASYHRWVVEELGKLDETLKEGGAEKFVHACFKKGGLFKVKFDVKNEDGRKKMAPSWPQHTAEVGAMLKEIKTEKAA